MEIVILSFFLAIAFVVAPVLTNSFFLGHSRFYADAHRLALLTLLVAIVSGVRELTLVWPLFCVYGLLYYIKLKSMSLLSLKNLATCIPFAFSLISSVWFFAGANDLYLLGYGQEWSYYAALHGSFLGWMFVGCLAYLSQRENDWSFLWLSYACFPLFLLVAFGIDGFPFIKKIGVIGFSFVVPFSYALYFYRLPRTSFNSRRLILLGLASVSLSMLLALLNEFWIEAPRILFGLPVMVLTHGLLNATVSVPCFFLAIRSENREVGKGVKTDPAPVIFFDGVCVLCIETVSILLKLDKRRGLRYSSLQGKLANDVLKAQASKDPTSVVFRKDGVSYEKSQAVIQILFKLGGFYKMIGLLFSGIPSFILDELYDLVAASRYRVFGKKDTCYFPTDSEKDLFIP